MARFSSEREGDRVGHRSYGHATSAGVVRDQNEDSLCVRPDIGLWAVADGMGGYRAGDMASRLTVEHLAEDVGNHVSLSESISRIHQKILHIARTASAYESMGSTVVALKTDGSVYEIAWVGDSRAYLWNRQLTRLTRDHSYVQSLVDAGTISEAEAANHPERHAITQALGAEGLDAIEVETVKGVFKVADRILLCSDGLTNEVADTEISKILAQPVSEQTLVDNLIAAAKENGGGDNISAILVSGNPGRVEGAADADAGAPQAASVMREAKAAGYQFWIWMVIIFLVLIIAVIFVYDVV